MFIQFGGRRLYEKDYKILYIKCQGTHEMRVPLLEAPLAPWTACLWGGFAGSVR